MRILIINWSSRKVAGIEDYLTNLIPALQQSGHELAFAYEVDVPQTREWICLPANSPSWDLSKLGVQTTIENMKSWKPDLIYAHGLLDPQFEAKFLDIAPAVYFSHNYYGTCISGLKTFKFPVARPCGRRFSAACLLHYFPRRCGGRNPITMLKLFIRESRRLANFKKYQAIVTHSSHMRQEYIRNGVPESRVHNFVYEAAKPQQKTQDAMYWNTGDANRAIWNLLFVGRMEQLKGGMILINALPIISAQLGWPIRLVLAGDGPERATWEKRASRMRVQNPSLKIEFTGWVDKTRLDTIYAQTDLLVVPSVWPEPFGRIGPEAGLRGIPVAAFNVGGIKDWLIDGVNGFLAPADPPTAVGLANAVVKCLQDPDIYPKLRTEAVAIASEFNLAHHLEALFTVFDQVIEPARTS